MLNLASTLDDDHSSQATKSSHNARNNINTFLTKPGKSSQAQSKEGSSGAVSVGKEEKKEEGGSAQTQKRLSTFTGD